MTTEWHFSHAREPCSARPRPCTARCRRGWSVARRASCLTTSGCPKTHSATPSSPSTGSRRLWNVDTCGTAWSGWTARLGPWCTASCATPGSIGTFSRLTSRITSRGRSMLSSSSWAPRWPATSSRALPSSCSRATPCRSSSSPWGRSPRRVPTYSATFQTRAVATSCWRTGGSATTQRATLPSPCRGEPSSTAMISTTATTSPCWRAALASWSGGGAS